MSKSKKNKSLVKELFNGDTELALFFGAWLECERNATKAMLKIRPSLSYATAATLGWRMLKKVDKELVLQSYDLNLDAWMNQLKDGMNAKKVISAKIIGKKADESTDDFIEVPDHQARLPYHTKLGELLGIEGKKNDAPVMQFFQFIQSQQGGYQQAEVMDA